MSYLLIIVLCMYFFRTNKDDDDNEWCDDVKPVKNINDIRQTDGWWPHADSRNKHANKMHLHYANKEENWKLV